MKYFFSALLVIFVSIFTSGCSTVAPKYNPSVENVQLLKDNATSQVKVGEFISSTDAANHNPISIRASRLESPYGGSYANYVSEAIKQELLLAKLHSSDSMIEITGTLLKNDIDASGFSTGTADITVRFVVKRAGEVKYDAVKTAHTEYPSSFVGNIAIPRAIQEYVGVVQKVLNSLYTDKAFLAAIK